MILPELEGVCRSKPGTPKCVASHGLKAASTLGGRWADSRVGLVLIGDGESLGALRTVTRYARAMVAPHVRVALYHRVSTVDQNSNAAYVEPRASARRRGLRMVLDVRDTGRVTNNDRPELLRVLKAAQQGEIDQVLVWRLDRFGRSAFDLLGNIRQLEAAGVRFMAITPGNDIQDAYGFQSVTGDTLRSPGPCWPCS